MSSTQPSSPNKAAVSQGKAPEAGKGTRVLRRVFHPKPSAFFPGRPVKPATLQTNDKAAESQELPKKVLTPVSAKERAKKDSRNAPPKTLTKIWSPPPAAPAQEKKAEAKQKPLQKPSPTSTETSPPLDRTHGLHASKRPKLQTTGTTTTSAPSKARESPRVNTAATRRIPAGVTSQQNAKKPTRTVSQVRPQSSLSTQGHSEGEKKSSVAKPATAKKQGVKGRELNSPARTVAGRKRKREVERKADKEGQLEEGEIKERPKKRRAPPKSNRDCGIYSIRWD